MPSALTLKLVYWAKRAGLYSILFSISRFEERLTCRRLSHALIVSRKGTLSMSLSPEFEQKLWAMDYLESEMQILRLLQEEFEKGVRALDFEKEKSYKVAVNSLFYHLLMRINARNKEGFSPHHRERRKKAQVLTKLGLFSPQYLKRVAQDGRLDRLLKKVFREEEVFVLTLSRS